MPLLIVQRQRILLIEVLKFHNKQGTLYLHTPLHDLFLPAGNAKPLRSNYSLVQPKCFSSTCGLN